MIEHPYRWDEGAVSGVGNHHPGYELVWDLIQTPEADVSLSEDVRRLLSGLEPTRVGCWMSRAEWEIRLDEQLTTPVKLSARPPADGVNGLSAMDSKKRSHETVWWYRGRFYSHWREGISADEVRTLIEAHRIKEEARETEEVRKAEEDAHLLDKGFQEELEQARRVVEKGSIEPDAREEVDPVVGRLAIPRHVKREVWRREEGKCTECGSREKLEFDHIIPLAMGGSNTERNIQLLCESCNRRKGATL